jgi:hypothetical protein
VGMLATQGMTALRPAKRHNTSITDIANQEVIMVGITNLVHHFKVIQISTQISIKINLH